MACGTCQRSPSISSYRHAVLGLSIRSVVSDPEDVFCQRVQLAYRSIHLASEHSRPDHESREYSDTIDRSLPLGPIPSLWRTLTAVMHTTEEEYVHNVIT